MKITDKKLFWFFTVFLLTLVLFIFQSFQYNPASTKSSSGDSSWPTKRELRRKLWQIRKELFVYGTGNPAVVESYRKCAENYARQMRWYNITVKPDSLITASDIVETPLRIIGTPISNSILAQMQKSLPVEIERSKFSIGKASYSDMKDVFVLSIYPNPVNPSMPISIVSGNSDQSVIDFLNGENNWSFRGVDIRVFRDGQGVAFGFFKQNKNGDWEYDTNNSRNYLDFTHTIYETPHYIYIYHGQKVPEQAIRKFAKEQEDRMDKLCERLTSLKIDLSAFPKINYHLYETLEDKGLITRNTDLSHFNVEKWQVHAVFNDELIGGDFYSDARLVFEKFVGQTKSEALRDGLGMYFSHDWGNHGYQYWAKLFHQTGNVNPLENLLNSNLYNNESYLFMRPLAGSFVEFLISEYGWTKFFELYQIWPQSGLPNQMLDGFTLNELEKRWRTHLERLNVGIKRTQKAKSVFQPKFQRGFSYAHEGYQIYNGYLSRESFQSLQKLRSMGTDWISVTPFGYLDDRNKPGYFHYSFGAGSENDESLIQVFLHAKKLGMGVMLKPHVLLHSRNWGWPGEVEMKNEKDWQLFFKYYYSWIRHYALLAEMYNMDMFCIGVELMQTTRDHQQEWRDIIAKVRQIYHGPIVYAANWYQEFEHITFWDELDYIGLNLYYPLSKNDTVSLADLKKGMSTGMPVVKKVVSQYNKPLLLTEVGFTSTAKSWQNPHERDRRATVNLEDQALSYRAIFECFWDKEWFYGFYWWKWPTYLENGGEDHNGFTPNGKPAEEVVQEWYSKGREP